MRAFHTALAWILLASAAPTFVPAQEMATLVVEVEVPEGTDTVYLPGSLPELGPWNPGLFPMEGEGTLRRAELRVPVGTTVSFKFTQGSWFREAILEDCTVPDNVDVLVNEDTTKRVKVAQFRGLDHECPWPDPYRYVADIEGFEEEDAKNGITKGAFLATGSSSIRMWHPQIGEDLAPLTIVPRGFGGSTIYDLLHFYDRVVLPYEPSAIMVYEGDNDVAAGVFPKTILSTYKEFIDRVHSDFPNAHIYILPAKPSLQRWELWPRMEEVNAGFAAFAEEDLLVTYIDVATPILGEDGMPRPELFEDDGLHLNRKGYEAWTEAIREVVIPEE